MLKKYLIGVTICLIVLTGYRAVSPLHAKNSKTQTIQKKSTPTPHTPTVNPTLTPILPPSSIPTAIPTKTKSKIIPISQYEVQSSSFSNPTQADVKIIESDTIQYYDIQGTTADELYSQLYNLGDKVEDVRIALASNQPFITIDGFPRFVDNKCAPGDIDINVRIVFTYPRWVNQSDAPADLVNKWNNFFAGVQTHENGHKNITMVSANEIKDAINSMNPVSCDEFNNKMNEIAQPILDQINGKQEQYDNDTNHGETQVPSLY